MKLSVSLVLLCVFQFVGGSVLPLVAKNFTLANDSSVQLSFVMFFAPWCSHSKEFLPIFSAVARDWSSDSCHFHSVDCVEDKELYWTHRIKGFPTIKAFLHGRTIEYDDDLDYKSFLSFVRSISTSDIYYLVGENGDEESRHDFLAFVDDIVRVKDTTAVLIIYISSPKQLIEYEKLLQLIDYACKKISSEFVSCVVTSNADILPKFHTIGESPTLLLHRNFNDEQSKIVYQSSLRADDSTILSWIQNYSYPLLTLFVEEHEKYLFSSTRPGFQVHLVVIVDSTSETWNNIRSTIERVAVKFRGRVIAVHLDPLIQTNFVQEALKDLQTITNIGDTIHPILILIHSQRQRVKFFELNRRTDISDESLTYWLDRFFADELQPLAVKEL